MVVQLEVFVNVNIEHDHANGIYFGGIKMVGLKAGLLIYILACTAVFGQNMSTGKRANEKTRNINIVIPPYKAQVPGTGLESPINLEEYLVGPGDGFLISIIELDPVVFHLTVSPGNRLIIPGSGMIDISGMTAAEVELATLELIKREHPKNKATCSLYGIREFKISVTGAVQRPDFYRLTPMSRLSDALKMAGGWKTLAALKRIIIYAGNGDTVHVDYTKFLESGDLRNNPRIVSGDGINVPLSNIGSETMLIGGFASPPVYQSVWVEQNLLNFLSNWYNPKSRASITAVDVIRNNDLSNLETVEAQEFAAFILQPGDEIYIRTVAAVHLVGEVRRPGRYNYQPGLRVSDYIALASGVSSEGSRTRVIVTHADGSVDQGQKTFVIAGDVVLVPRSLRSVMVGQTGIIQVLLAALNMYLAFLAASN